MSREFSPGEGKEVCHSVLAGFVAIPFVKDGSVKNAPGRLPADQSQERRRTQV